MKLHEHILSSWERVKKNYTALYEKDKLKTFQVVREIPNWFDDFAGKRGKGYDYTKWVTPHREQRHHLDGIQECVITLSRKYGLEYHDLILTEATRHVKDDMGYIPQKEDYKRKDFWENWSMRNENHTTNC